MCDLHDDPKPLPLVVRPDGPDGPHLVLASGQDVEVRRLLVAAAIPYVLEPGAIDSDGRPVGTVIHFGEGADVARIQAVLNARD